jgi:uncharacterized membrane protein
MTDDEKFVMIAATYVDVAAAEGDFDAMKRLYDGADLIGGFDAVVIGRKVDGEVKIYKKHEGPNLHGRWVGDGWGLATGLAMTLFPAVGISVTDWTAATGAGLGAIAGQVAGGLSRTDLKDLGDHLDEAAAGLIVAASADMADRVDAAITNADSVTRKLVTYNRAALHEALAEAETAVNDDGF